jgi:uncharacterized phage protein (TIGR02218 family)
MSDVWLTGALTTAAYGWRLERSDGITLGFSSHDRDLEIGGLLYRSNPGLTPSTIVESLSLENDGMELSGGISDAAISQADLQAGRWDKARLTIFLFDWTDPSLPSRILAHGELGEIAFSGNRFETELRGMYSLLDRPVVPATSPGCRAQFCDAACGLNAQRFMHEAAVISASDDRIALSAALPGQAGDFAYGQIRWLEGDNCGLIGDVIANDGTSVTLADAPAFPILAPVRAAFLQGCDKRLATCAARFGNAINFRGEPHLPGNDLLTRYPGGA